MRSTHKENLARRGGNNAQWFQKFTQNNKVWNYAFFMTGSEKENVDPLPSLLVK